MCVTSGDQPRDISESPQRLQPISRSSACSTAQGHLRFGFGPTAADPVRGTHLGRSRGGAVLAGPRVPAADLLRQNVFDLGQFTFDGVDLGRAQDRGGGPRSATSEWTRLPSACARIPGSTLRAHGRDTRSVPWVPDGARPEGIEQRVSSPTKPLFAASRVCEQRVAVHVVFTQPLRFPREPYGQLGGRQLGVEPHRHRSTWAPGLRSYRCPGQQGGPDGNGEQILMPGQPWPRRHQRRIGGVRDDEPGLRSGRLPRRWARGRGRARARGIHSRSRRPAPRRRAPSGATPLPGADPRHVRPR